MRIDRSLRRTDHRVVAGLVVTLAGVVGAIGFAVGDPDAAH